MVGMFNPTEPSDSPFPTGKQAEDLNAVWDSIQARVKASRDPDAVRNAVRFILVNCFGNDVQYSFDAVFHARVHAAEQMLERLRDLNG